MTQIFQPDNLCFTADTHFDHNFMVDWRGFSSQDEMNHKLIQNWNGIVQPESVIFHLGDVHFAKQNRALEVLLQLNGKIHLIAGNHDKKLKHAIKNVFHSVHNYLEIDVVQDSGNKQRIVMSHFPFRSWNRHHYGSWHLHGHCHGNLPSIGKSMDVGLDPNCMHPITFDYIRNLMNRRDIHTCDHHIRSNHAN